MTDEEALRNLENGFVVVAMSNGVQTFGFKESVLADAAHVAMQALREKVAASEPKRPTLKELERWLGELIVGYVVNADDICMSRHAINAIKAVREDTIPHLHGMARAVRDECASDVARWGVERLRALGEAT